MKLRRRIPLLLSMSLSFGAACETEPPTSRDALDRETYAESARLVSTDANAAAQLCLKIDDGVLQGECATFAAKALAGQRGDPLPVCAQLKHDGWQQVCYFEASDGAGLIGKPAISACQRSGEFIERCLSHALSRHADREWRAVPLGQEQDFLTWLEDQIPVYGLEAGYQDMRKDFLARRIAERIRKAAPGGAPRAFQAADCGTAPAVTCAEAYRYLVRGLAADKNVYNLCSAPVTMERVQAAGLPTWPDGDPAVVDPLWKRMCRELQGAGRPPPHLPPR